MSADNKKAGLRQRPTYNELIEEIQLDEKIKLPNRQAKFLRESPYLSFLDGETLMEMNAQQENADKQTQVEQAIRQQATASGGTASIFRAQQQAQSSQNSFRSFTMGSGASVQGDPMDTDDNGTANVSGAVGAGGSYDPSTGTWTAAPDPLQDWYGSTTASVQPHLPDDAIPLSPRITQITQQPAPKPIQISNALPNDTTIDEMMDSLVAGMTYRDDAIRKIQDMIDMQGGANTAPLDVPDVPIPLSQAKPKAKPKPPNGKPKAKPKAKSKAAPEPSQPASSSSLGPPYDPAMERYWAEFGGRYDQGPPAASSSSQGPQPASSSSQGPQVFPNGNPVKGKPAPKPTPATGVKPNPAFQKKSQSKPRQQHGTELDTSTDKKYWATKGIGYLKDQLDKRGIRINPAKLRGKNALNKGDLLKMLYKHDGL